MAKLKPIETHIVDPDLINEMMGNQERELLPCPFCGNKLVGVSGWVNEDTGNAVMSVSCIGTLFECSATITTCVKNTEVAIKEATKDLKAAWNKRA